MPARVHAILVVRPDGRTPAAFHLRRTLAALAEQARPVDVLTIVLCGGDDILADVARSSTAESVVTTSAATGYADALALVTPRLDGDAVWLLAQDTAPEPDALARLAGSLELSPSVAFVAPKLVRWDDRSEIVSLGVGMTRLGRAVGLADGELDQGQHDGREDVLGADVRAILVRADAWRQLGGLDRALLGADEGLDLGVRARLAGARVSLVPTALVATAGDGVAGLPSPLTPQRRRRAAFAARTAATAPPARLRARDRPAVPVACDPAAGAVAHARPSRPQGAGTHRAGVGRGLRRVRTPGRRRTGPSPSRRDQDRLVVAARRAAHDRQRTAPALPGRARRRRHGSAPSPQRAALLLRGRCLARARRARGLDRSLPGAAGMAGARRRCAAAAACHRRAAVGGRRLRSARPGPRHHRPGRPVRVGDRRARVAVAGSAVVRAGGAVGPGASPRCPGRLVRRHTGHRSVDPAAGRRCAVGAVAHVPRRSQPGPAGGGARPPAAAVAVPGRICRTPVVGGSRSGVPAAGSPRGRRALARARARGAVGRRRHPGGRAAGRSRCGAPHLDAHPHRGAVRSAGVARRARRRGVGAARRPGRAVGRAPGGRGRRRARAAGRRHPDARSRRLDDSAPRRPDVVGAAAGGAAGAAGARVTAHAAVGRGHRAPGGHRTRDRDRVRGRRHLGRLRPVPPGAAVAGHRAQPRLDRGGRERPSSRWTRAWRPASPSAARS